MAFSRRLPTALLGLSAALWASPGLAQTTSTSITTSTTTALTTSDFTLALQRQSGNTWVDLTTTEAATYLNQARCQCATPVQILVQMAPASTSKLASLTTVGTVARLYVGTDCASLDANNVRTCPDSQILGEMNGIANLARAPWYVPTTVDKLFAPLLGGCSPAQSATTISLWLDSTGYGYPDSGVTGSAAPSLGITAIGTPPSAPDGITVEGGDEALVVSWSPISTTTVPNLAGFLVFCMRGNGLQVFNPSYYNYSSDYNNSSDTNQYLTSQILCPPGTPVTPTLFTSVAATTTAEEVPAEEVGAPNQFLNLDPDYLCSGLLPPTQTNLRLEILQNGIPYTVGVAAVDTSGNASPIGSGFVQKPVPTINFYQEYRDAGGQSPGGYCALAGRDAQLGTISLLAGTGLLALIILRRRRRKRRALSRGLPFLLLLLAVRPVHAQTLAHEGDEMPVDQPESYRTPREWAFEARFGPYRPNVDSEFSSSAVAPPYQAVFGGKRHLMSQLELDWQFFQAFGSLAAGVVIGYYNESAKAFKANPTGGCVLDSTGACVRSGDTTTLRLIPMAALLVYRWDVAAVQWKIPLVPYGKLGLNYTLWQINDGNGNVPDYKSGHGSGGTAGWQAAAGVALQLDFLDPDATRSLDMETGINHSYAFFEWNRVDATGLGMSNKLHVGDSRWVVGLMFEF
jgi:hypothetical protein